MGWPRVGQQGCEPQAVQAGTIGISSFSAIESGCDPPNQAPQTHAPDASVVKCCWGSLLGDERIEMPLHWLMKVSSRDIHLNTCDDQILGPQHLLGCYCGIPVSPPISPQYEVLIVSSGQFCNYGPGLWLSSC